MRGRWTHVEEELSANLAVLDHLGSVILRESVDGRLSLQSRVVLLETRVSRRKEKRASAIRVAERRLLNGCAAGEAKLPSCSKRGCMTPVTYGEVIVAVTLERGSRDWKGGSKTRQLTSFLCR